MPRPRLHDEAKLQVFTVRVSVKTLDSIYHVAHQRGEEASPLVRRALSRLFGMLDTSSTQSACYARPRVLSTATRLVADSSSSRTSQDSGPVAPPSVVAAR